MWSRGNSLALSGEDLLEELRLMLMTCNLWLGLHVQIRRGYPAREVINLTDSFIKHVVEVQWACGAAEDTASGRHRRMSGRLTSAVSGHSPSGNQSEEHQCTLGTGEAQHAQFNLAKLNISGIELDVCWGEGG